MYCTSVRAALVSRAAGLGLPSVRAELRDLHADMENTDITPELLAALGAEPSDVLASKSSHFVVAGRGPGAIVSLPTQPSPGLDSLAAHGDEARVQLSLALLAASSPLPCFASLEHARLVTAAVRELLLVAEGQGRSAAKPPPSVEAATLAEMLGVHSGQLDGLGTANASRGHGEAAAQPSARGDAAAAASAAAEVAAAAAEATHSTASHATQVTDVIQTLMGRPAGHGRHIRRAFGSGASAGPEALRLALLAGHGILRVQGSRIQLCEAGPVALVSRIVGTCLAVVALEGAFEHDLEVQALDLEGPMVKALLDPVVLRAAAATLSAPHAGAVASAALFAARSAPESIRALSDSGATVDPVASAALVRSARLSPHALSVIGEAASDANRRLEPATRHVRSLSGTRFAEAVRAKVRVALQAGRLISLSELATHLRVVLEPLALRRALCFARVMAAAAPRSLRQRLLRHGSAERAKTPGQDEAASAPGEAKLGAAEASALAAGEALGLRPESPPGDAAAAAASCMGTVGEAIAAYCPELRVEGCRVVCPSESLPALSGWYAPTASPLRSASGVVNDFPSLHVPRSAQGAQLPGWTPPSAGHTATSASSQAGLGEMTMYPFGKPVVGSLHRDGSGPSLGPAPSFDDRTALDPGDLRREATTIRSVSGSHGPRVIVGHAVRWGAPLNLPERHDRELKALSKSGWGLFLQAMLPKYASSFLNSTGGSLYFGVNDDRSVDTMALPEKQQDHFVCMVDKVLSSCVRPPLDGRYYDVQFFPVSVPSNDAEAAAALRRTRLNAKIPAHRALLADYHIAKITFYVQDVFAARGYEALASPGDAASATMFVRHQASSIKLTTPSQVAAWYRRRLEDIHVATLQILLRGHQQSDQPAEPTPPAVPLAVPSSAASASTAPAPASSSAAGPVTMSASALNELVDRVATQAAERASTLAAERAVRLLFERTSRPTVPTMHSPAARGPSRPRPFGAPVPSAAAMSAALAAAQQAPPGRGWPGGWAGRPAHGAGAQRGAQALGTPSRSWQGPMTAMSPPNPGARHP